MNGDLDDRETAEFSIGGLSWNLELFDSSVVIFTPAYYERHMSGGLKLKPALVTEEDITLDRSGRTKLEKKELGAAGFELATTILHLYCNVHGLKMRLSASADEWERKLAAAIITLIWALKKAISITLQIELGDVGVYWSLDPSNWMFHLYFYDTNPGGSGICRRIMHDCITKKEIFQLAKETLYDESCCKSYCDRCLLLPRTPESIIRKGLLNKIAGRIFFENKK